MITIPKLYMTIEEAANYTGLSKFYIRNGCRKNEIPHIMAGKKYLVNVRLFLARLEGAQEEQEANEA